MTSRASTFANAWGAMTAPAQPSRQRCSFFFFKQKTAYEIGLGIPAEPLFRSRMQGVEFDNGDMYVDGHKAASDVRDEFVSVTEKLMDELAQCYNVLPQLDINNTIDHRPEGDEKWFLENEKTV